jgi:hypothetical protein
MASGVVLVCAPLWAQQPPPLAEVAKREAERRKTVTSPTKVLTNTDVKRGLPLTTGAAPADKPAPAVTSAPPPDQALKPPTETKDEAWWRKRMSELRDQLNHSRLFADALQSRVNALWADFTARDDPQQRAIIERTRNEALVELEKVKTEITRQEQAIADAEEEARKAGVPEGWLR